MSRLSDAINRLELVAKKMEMSIEEALSVLEGGSITHKVVQTHELVPVKATPANPIPASAQSTPTAVGSGDAAQGATLTGSAAGLAPGIGLPAPEHLVSDEVAAQNKAAAESDPARIPGVED